MALVQTKLDSGLFVITMADSPSGNRLNSESLAALTDAFEAAFSSDEARAILLRSNGENFCFGMDLAFLQANEGAEELARDTISRYTDLLFKIYSGPKPVVALVNGAVKAGGVGLMAACDIVVASENASLQLSEVLLGLIPANVLPFLYGKRLTPQKVRYYVMSAKTVGAEEALANNLFDEVFPAGSLEKNLRNLFKNLFRAAPSALAATKQFTTAISSLEMEQACAVAKDSLFELVTSKEVLAAVEEFNEWGSFHWAKKFRPEKPLVSEG